MTEPMKDNVICSQCGYDRPLESTLPGGEGQAWDYAPHKVGGLSCLRRQRDHLRAELEQAQAAIEAMATSSVIVEEYQDGEWIYNLTTWPLAKWSDARYTTALAAVLAGLEALQKEQDAAAAAQETPCPSQ